MKNKLLKFLALTAMSFTAATAMAVDGDIYEVRACHEDGTTYDEASYPIWPKGSTKSTEPGQPDMYFRMRFFPRETTTGESWYLKYNGYNEKLDWAINPPRVRIFVGDVNQEVWADMCDYQYNTVGGYKVADFIFHYVPKSGDFALPIVLGAYLNGVPAPIKNMTSTPTTSYVFDMRGSMWEFKFNPDDPSTTVEPRLWIHATAEEGISREKTTVDGNRVLDASLANAGFNVETVTFKDAADKTKWDVPNEFWREVHKDTTVTVGSTPQIVRKYAATEATTLYVWSTNENAVIVQGADTFKCKCDPYSTHEYTVARIKIGSSANENAAGDFLIRGVNMTNDVAGVGESAIVLSCYTNFNKKVSLGEEIWDDYVTIPVRCIEPMPPTVIVDAEGVTEVTASSDYLQAAARLTIKLSQHVDEKFAVRLHPRFSADSGVDLKPAEWGKYVRFSTTSDHPGDLPDATEDSMEVELGGSAGDSKTVYVFALRSDANVDGSLGNNRMVFAPYATAGAWPAAIEDEKSDSFKIKAQNPVITKPTEGERMTPNPIRDDPDGYKLDICVDDTFADMSDTNQGYQVWAIYSYAPALSDAKRVGGDGATYYRGAGGKLYRLDNGNYGKGIQPALDFTQASDDEVWVKLYVKSPVSGKTSDVDGEYRTIYFNKIERQSEWNLVTKLGNVITDEFNEGDTCTFEINLGTDAPSDMYAFIKATADFDNIKGQLKPMKTKQNFIIDTGAGSNKGLFIRKDANSVTGQYKLMDGYDEESMGGLQISFEVIFATIEDYVMATNNPSTYIVKKYGAPSTESKIAVYNVEPVIEMVTVDGLEDVENGDTLSGLYVAGQNHTFQLLVDDVDYDLENTNDVFQYQWTAKYNGTTKKKEVVDGDPNIHTFTNDFNAVGEWTVELIALDKDQDDKLFRRGGTVFSFKLNTTKSPMVMVTADGTDGGMLTIGERDNRASVNVSLSMFDKPDTLDGINVHVALTHANKQGDWGSIEVDSADLKFTGNGEVQRVNFRNLDGTTLSESDGWKISAYVTDEDEYKGQKLCDYYKKSDEPGLIYDKSVSCIYIKNVAPNNGLEDASFTPLANTNAWKVAGQATAHPLYFYVKNDTDQDFTNNWYNGSTETTTKGIKVTIIGANGESYNEDGFDKGVKYFTSSGSGKFIADFGSAQGEQPVTIMIEDKDGGSVSRTWLFDVIESKVLQTRAVGPSMGGNSAYPDKAKNLGKGRIYAQGPKFTSASGFQYNWNCSQDLSEEVVGIGYKVGDVDDGKLKYGNNNPGDYDIGITSGGSTYVNTDPYGYTDSVYDSFFYAWVRVSSSESTTTCSLEGGAIKPEHGAAESPAFMTVALAQKSTTSNSGGSTTTTETDKTPPTILEAIFSKELYPADNMGDINADGIPDLYYTFYNDFSTESKTGGTAAPGGDTAATLTYDDLKAHDTDNKDLDENEEEVGDFLPALLDAAYTSFSDKISTKIKFDAVTEIRGFGTGLNNAPEIVGITGVKPDRIYLDPDNCTTSTLSRVEYLAFVEWCAAQDPAVDPIDPTSWELWSPECPTSPLLADTDGDGFTDGYEYYFWYRAKVGYMDGNTNHCYETGRRFDVRNPGEGALITREEIMKLFNPIEKANIADSLTQDTDNDGLPDLLEFYLGTNPIDFDTDKDGLPDGWELVMAGTDPTKYASTVANGNVTSKMCDGERNYDGDAFAVTSAQLEESVLPKPRYINKLYSFAVVDADGDSDGVQWYVTANEPETEINTNVEDFVEVVLFTIAGDEKHTYATTATNLFKKTASGVLAHNLSRQSTFVVTTNTDDSCAAPYVRGYPVDILAGSAIASSETGVKCSFVKLAKALGEYEANAAWIYGRNADVDATKGELTTDTIKSLYGNLAIGRYKAVAKDAKLCVLPSNERDVLYLHYLVYQEFGFDARTAWKAGYPLANRYAKAADASASESTRSDVQVLNYGYAAYPTRTAEYKAYDEFLLMSFLANNGKVAKSDMAGDARAYPWATIWEMYTTNPRGPGHTLINEVTVNDDTEEVTLGELEGSDNGADTDNDGVPDGWELYVMAGPKDSKGHYVFEGITAGMSPINSYADSTDKTDSPLTWGDLDNLTEQMEYAGTDSVAYYASADNNDLGVAYSTTIVVPESQAKWINKFYPTDPWNKDTDGDNVDDDKEGQTFIYGTPADGGLVSNPGGGLNPCSVDTDMDGLPDGWERQFKGNTIYTNPTGVSVCDPSYAKVDGADVGNPLEGLCDGMDGTVMDAYTIPNQRSKNGDTVTTTVKSRTINGLTMNSKVNRDYDHDGLENWQEYMTGAMRCWRYDDPYSPWRAIPGDWYFDENGVFAPNIEKFGFEDMNEFWYETFFNTKGKYYNPMLISDAANGAQYFTRIDNGFDPVYRDLLLPSADYMGGAYYIFYDRVAGMKIETYWVDGEGEGLLKIPGPLAELVDAYSCNKAPQKYISCSPINYDSDHDGMDDYYELFHGMNPMLGASGVALSAQGNINGPCDLVYDAWVKNGYTTAIQAWGDNANYWMTEAGKAKLPVQPRGNGFDFVAYPWLNGLQSADPDGDNLRNDEESIAADLADAAWHHTDPTPLWMTDTSYSNSLTRLYYRMPASFGYVIPEVGLTFEHKGETYDFRQVASYAETGQKLLPWVIGQVLPDQWNLTASSAMNWMFSFEENEGYDTDHDGISDADEVEGKFNQLTDPQTFEEPHRRQAMYFQGKDKPSILQTMPFVDEKHPVASVNYEDELEFMQYTVEAWVCPESLDNATIIERAIWTDPAHPMDQEYLRCNFQLAIKDGKWYTKFDNRGTEANTPVYAFSDIAAEMNKWTHLAATYDGARLTLYVNGRESGYRTSSAQPEYGSSAMAFKNQWTSNMTTHVTWGRQGEFHFDNEYKYHAIIMGASAIPMAEGGTNTTLDVTESKGFSQYKDFYKGYIDEVRIWDGARSDLDIKESMNTRYTVALAKENRDDFYDQWSSGMRRYRTDGTATGTTLIPELRYHYTFDSVFGAENDKQVAIEPFGFDNNSVRADGSRPMDYRIKWFDKVLKNYANTVYCSPRWVEWVPNTVTHLPRFDGTTMDSAYWSDDYAGYSSMSMTFNHTAEPVSVWKQLNYNGVGDEFNFRSTGERYYLVNDSSACGAINAAKIFEFNGRHQNQQGDDMIALGGAFVKYVDSTIGMWDDQGASSIWELTGNDADLDGLPDWWELYADENYRINPADEIGWMTMVNYNNQIITAGEAYLLDLASGMYVAANGSVIKDADGARFEQRADEDGDGMRDAWEIGYGVHTDSYEDAMRDDDNDGLANYYEYLVSKGDAPWGYTNLNPTTAYSLQGQRVSDYYLKVPEAIAAAYPKQFIVGEYLGEILTDHDFMEDWWEEKYSNHYSSVGEYDPNEDTDGDGWDNYSECRAALWGGMYLGDIIDQWLDDGTHAAAHPRPAIGLHITYDDTVNKQDISSQPLIVRTFTDGRRSDATFYIKGASSVSSSTNHFVGAYYDGCTEFRGFLNPGCILPGEVRLYRSQMASDRIYTWEYEVWEGSKYIWCRASGSFETYRWYRRNYSWVVLVEQSINWGDAIGLTSSDGDGRMGVIRYSGTNTTSSAQIGTVNFRTGEYTLDMRKLVTADGDQENCIYKIEYSYKIGQYWPQTVWVSESNKGYIKQGKNKVEAWIDMNGNNQFDAGEPYGFVRDIDVGWHMTPEITLELRDESPIIDRTTISSQQSKGGNSSSTSQTTDSLTKNIRVVREAINNRNLGDHERSILSKEMILDDSTALTERDVISGGNYDLDWKWLNNDAKERGFDNVYSVTYRVEEIGNTSTNAEDAVLGRFTREFSVGTRPMAEAVEPLNNTPVYTASPTFVFKADQAATAFSLQIADSTGKVIYDSGIQGLIGRSGASLGVNACTFTPSVFVDVELADGADYKWRVALYNARYNTLPNDGAYTEWANFQMDVDNKNRHTGAITGYGRAAAVVRYYGPAFTNDTKTLGGELIVEAYRRADFSGQPESQMVVSNLDDLASDQDIATTNALLRGIEPGTVYLLAYIDRNGNHKRDKYESWGYANYVAYSKNYSAIYNPWGLTVKEGIVSWVSTDKVVIYIEDTDCDKNEIPDCMQGLDELISNEDIIKDTDDDGMPDVYEESFGTDPEAKDDDYYVGGDVMAYYDLKVLFVDIGESAEATKRYALVDFANEPLLSDGLIPKRTDASLLRSAISVYNYGNDGLYGAGTNVTLTTGKVWNSVMGTVRLVHAQVYAYCGFNTLTANGEAYEDNCATNTKPFTALDKYMVARYLENIGVEGASEKLLLATGEIVPGVKWTLQPGVVDGDNDGIADGWELYTMFGPKGGLSNFMNGKFTQLADAKVSPFNGEDGLKDSPDGDLKLVEEYDGGHYPTDPWNVDSDNDTVADKYAYQYHLKGDDARKDNDGDGLSNYSEYLISEVFKFANIGKLNPDNPKTNGHVLDYYLKVDQMYLGEMFQDHDRMTDMVEDEFNKLENVTGFNRYEYDSHIDSLGYGWSNYATVKSYEAGKLVKTQDTEVPMVASNMTTAAIALLELDPSVKSIRKEYESTEYSESGNRITWTDKYTVRYTKIISGSQSYLPSPEIRAKISYIGNQLSSGEKSPLVVKFYSDEKMHCLEATYVLTNAIERGINNVVLNEDNRVSGHVREGRNWVLAYVRGVNDMSGGEANSESVYVYQAGMPYGVNTKVMVGWANPSFELELTDMTAVFDRISPFDGSSSRKEFYGSDSVTEFAAGLTNGINAISPTADAKMVHIRIVPYSVRGTKQDLSSYDKNRSGEYRLVNAVGSRVVAEFDVDVNAHPFITEADIIRDGKYDIDWDLCYSNICRNSDVIDAVGEVTAIKYLIVVGQDGPIGPLMNLDTNTVTRALSPLVERRFEVVRTKPVVKESLGGADGYIYSARPTFKWRLDESTDAVGYASSAAYFGCSYPAFRIQVTTTDDVNFRKPVYDSGLTRTPIRDQDGNFVFEAPFYPENGNYMWRVSMYNSRYINDAWSDNGYFAMDANNQQEMNDHGYGEIKVAARYTGPSKVLQDGVVTIEAFDTPDFAGDPLAQVQIPVAQNAIVADAYNQTDFVAVKGLKMDGTYYIRAFIDQNGNRQCDLWESWNGSEGVYLNSNDFNNRNAPVVGVFIEDSDTDNDWIPDAYEYALYGRKGEYAFADIKNHLTASTTSTISLSTVGDAGISTGLKKGASLTVFETGSFANTLLELDGSRTFEDIRAAVKKELKTTSVTITGLTLDPDTKELTLHLDSDVALSLAGQYVGQVYGISMVGEPVNVVVKVLRKATLAEEEWKVVDTQTININSTQPYITVPLGAAYNPTSGFYKIEVVQ